MDVLAFVLLSGQFEASVRDGQRVPQVVTHHPRELLESVVLSLEVTLVLVLLGDVGDGGDDFARVRSLFGAVGVARLVCRHGDGCGVHRNPALVPVRELHFRLVAVHCLTRLLHLCDGELVVVERFTRSVEQGPRVVVVVRVTRKPPFVDTERLFEAPVRPDDRSVAIEERHPDRKRLEERREERVRLL